MASIHHVRSISLPSRSHPTTLKIEDELNRLKTVHATSKSISTGLSELGDLYQCMDDLLNMTSTQRVLSVHRHEKCIDELLDVYVRLLDICGIARDYMFQIKEHVHALQSAFRRRKGHSSIENSIIRYTSFRKDMKRKSKKLIAELKRIDNKLEASTLSDNDHHFSAVIRVIRRVNVTNTTIFQSIFSFLSTQVASKKTRWSMVRKLMHKGTISCEDKRLECVFRELIKARTSLLNIISQ